MGASSHSPGQRSRPHTEIKQMFGVVRLRGGEPQTIVEQTFHKCSSSGSVLPQAEQSANLKQPYARFPMQLLVVFLTRLNPDLRRLLYARRLLQPRRILRLALCRLQKRHPHDSGTKQEKDHASLQLPFFGLAVCVIIQQSSPSWSEDEGLVNVKIVAGNSNPIFKSFLVFTKSFC